MEQQCLIVWELCKFLGASHTLIALFVNMTDQQVTDLTFCTSYLPKTFSTWNLCLFYVCRSMRNGRDLHH